MAAPRVLLTGATGFIGGHILERLMREAVEIVAASRSGTGPYADRVGWRGVDLRDPAAAERLIAEVRPTHLIHSAWMAVPGRFWTDPENEDWLLGGTAMVRAFGATGGHFTGVGTCAEYDSQAATFVEDETPIAPNTLYGRAKAMMWDAAQSASAGAGSGAVWVRVFLPYGPGDNAKRLIPSVISALRAGKRVALSAGTQERDFIHVSDVADLVVRLAIGTRNGAFNAGTGRPTAVRDAVLQVARALGGENLLDFGARPMPANEPARLVADMTKVESTLGGWSPTTLEAGLAALLQSQ